MSLERQGFVGLFLEPLGQERIEELALLWIERYGRVEQTIGTGAQALTQKIETARDIRWEDHLQFRVLSGEQFAWIYVSRNARVVETSGLAPEWGDILSRDVLTDLPGCAEIIDDRNDHRLDQLEAQGLM